MTAAYALVTLAFWWNQMRDDVGKISTDRCRRAICEVDGVVINHPADTK